ncbi:MAG: hypothetical protein AAF441_02810 [Pseudomonadota bacterium]
MIGRALRRSLVIALVGLVVLLAGKSMVQACGTVVKVTYIEDSPDVFVIEYPDGQDDLLLSVKIDLATSAAGAYVDTLYGPAKSNLGEAVEVGEIRGFAEGDQSGTILFKKFAAGHRLNMLVDLDDRGLSGEPDPDHLTGKEMEGGLVTARFRAPDGEAEEMSGAFDAEGVARLGSRACA